MPHWAEGLTAAYVVAALVVGIVLVTVDLPRWLRVVGALFWPAVLGLVLWSMWTARTET